MLIFPSIFPLVFRSQAWEFVDTALVGQRCRELCDEPGVPWNSR
jgi:hypothetical protein